MVAGRLCVDWRSSDAYLPLLHASRHGFAWEWLRRSRAYVEAREGRGECVDPSMFGLCAFEDATADILTARPIWHADADPFVLTARVSVTSGQMDFTDLVQSGRCLRSEMGEHWLWSDGMRHVRLDIVEGQLGGKVLGLEFLDIGLCNADAQALALRRLMALISRGRFIRGLYPPQRRAARWLSILRTYDALAAGATQGEIAEIFFAGYTRDRSGLRRSSYRERVRRLVAAAREAALTEPRCWLGGSWP